MAVIATEMLMKDKLHTFVFSPVSCVTTAGILDQFVQRAKDKVMNMGHVRGLTCDTTCFTPEINTNSK